MLREGRLHSMIKFTSFRSVSQFLRLCKIQRLRPVAVDITDGMGLAIDKDGNAYANLGPGTQTKDGWQFVMSTQSQRLDPLPQSIALRLFNEMFDQAEELETFAKGLHAWLGSVTQFVRQHEA